MANVIKTVLTYQLDGSKRDFNIPFEYLARKFVVVTLIGVDRKVLTINTDYRFATRTTISLTKSWGPADGYNVIELRRVTSTTDRLVDFTDGSILRAYDLNVAQIQTMHVAEEARDLTADTIGVNNDGHLDARGRKIVNLAFATGDYDAVPLKQIKERENSAWNAVIKTEEHANRSNNEANRSRDEADRARREADRSTQQAGVSTAHAVESKTQADRSNSEANRAKGYADSMTASVAEAKKQADRSNSEANRARDEANRASGEVTKAAAEVVKAAAHVETANRHADRANTEANRSKGEADRAKAEADKLGNMNGLADAVESVSGTTVTWAGHARFTSGVSIQRGDNKSRLYRQGFWGDGNQLDTDFVLQFEDGTARALMQFTYNKSNPLNANIRLQDNVNITKTLTVGSTSDMNGMVTINAPDLAFKLNGVAGMPNYMQGLRDGKAEWMVGTDHNNSQTFYSIQFGHGLYLQERKVAIGRPLHVGDAIFTTNGDSFGTAWGNGWLSQYLGRFIVDVWQAADVWTARSGGYNNVYCPAGNYMSGGGGTGAGFDGIFSRPMWIQFHTGATRIIAKK